MKRVLLISGKQGSGKTSNTERVIGDCELLGYVVGTFKFAEPLYKMHEACLPILKEYRIRPETMTKDGELLQVLGTEYGRNRISQDVWVKCCRERVNAWLSISSEHLAVIDDCRFENEFDAFPDAYAVRLECDRAVRKERCSYWRDSDAHPSEVGLDAYAARGKFDLTLFTDRDPLTMVSHKIRTSWFRNDSIKI